MWKVLACVAYEHDYRLVVLAVVICVFAASTAFSLFGRAIASEGARRWSWLAAGATVAGSGVWSTHFVAMLAYRSPLPLDYDVGLTAVSIATAIVVIALGWSIAIWHHGLASLGGGIAGGGIAAMHFLGMGAIRLPGTIDYNAGYVVAAMLIGVGLSAVASIVAVSHRVKHALTLGALIFGISVAGMHFTAMTAMTIIPSSEQLIQPLTVMPAEWMALGVAAVTTLIIALSLTGIYVDHRLAMRTIVEAATLRNYVSELEVTQATLMQREGALRKSTEDLSAEVTRRTHGEEALRKSERRLTGITANLFEGVLLVDANGHVLFSNRSANGLLLGEERPSEAEINLDDLMRVMAGDAALPFEQSPFLRAIVGGMTLVDDDAVFITHDGRRLCVGYAVAPLDEEGTRRGVVISFRNIEALKQAQREAMQSSRLASVGQLAAGIAHEINTPIQYIGDNLRFIHDSLDSIAGVTGGLKRLLDGTQRAADAAALCAEKDIAYLMEELPLAVSQSMQGVDSVAHIVRSMKEFSHPGTSAKVAVDLNRAIESTVTVSRNEWRQAATLETALDADLPPVLCFPAEINQVLLNLIVNAAHAIESVHTDKPGKILISSRAEGDFVEVRVADNGPGVPPEIRERIFDPFFTTKAVGKGTGQGLAICLDIVVNKHGGKLTAEESGSAGATFVLRLPIGDAMSRVDRSSDHAAD